MKQTYTYYRNKIITGVPLFDVLKEARSDYGYAPDYSFTEPLMTEGDIPFNIEREIILKLIEQRKYDEARNLLEEMKKTYRTAPHWNFIEIYEYHLHAILQSNKQAMETVDLQIIEAKKEFSNHTLTLITIIVGIVTLFGSANQIFKVNSFQEGVNTFFSIVLAVMAVIFLIFIVNGKFFKK